ncbi:MAG: hypothetical protein IMX05_09525 [Hydrogenibacillus schlegelii]|nr:hypothetical protein [Hydrogenibacillus schlegelii]
MTPSDASKYIVVTAAYFGRLPPAEFNGSNRSTEPLDGLQAAGASFEAGTAIHESGANIADAYGRNRLVISTFGHVEKIVAEHLAHLDAVRRRHPPGRPVRPQGGQIHLDRLGPQVAASGTVLTVPKDGYDSVELGNTTDRTLPVM